MHPPTISGTYGLAAIRRAAQSFQLVVTETLLSHNLGIDCQTLTWMEVCQAAQLAGLRAKYYPAMEGDLSTLPAPFLVCLDGKWSVIEKIEAGYWWRYDPATEECYQEPIAKGGV